MSDPHLKPLIIWRLLDGKPGHESQTLGLARAMQCLADERGQPADIIDVPVAQFRFSVWHFLLKRCRVGQGLPSPDFILGAGHRTHWPMLCARRAFGGKAIALMSPSLPLSWFDSVVIPEHDNRVGRNVIVTRGVLNAMQPGEKQMGKTLVLVGGEGKHFAWSSKEVMAQLERVAARFPQLQVTDSRRTPAAMRSELSARFSKHYMPWEQCPIGWLANELASAESVWVTEDSVSMIYEALSAGCRVGLVGLERPAGEPRRLVSGISRLGEQGLVTYFHDWKEGRIPLPQARVLTESTRVAKQILGEQ